MKKIVVKKEEQDKTVQITFRFKSLEQFFDEDDPNPLPDKELTEEAEDAISGHLDITGWQASSRCLIQLPGKILQTVSFYRSPKLPAIISGSGRTT